MEMQAGNPPFDITTTKDKGYMITGWTTGWGATATNARTFLLKLDSLGNKEWHKIYFTPLGIASSGTSIDTADNNEFIIAGIVNNNSSTNLNDMYTMRTDSAGNVIWVKMYPTPYTDLSRCYIKNIGNNEFLLAGGYGVDNGNGENIQYLLAKIDGANGNEIWADTSGIDAAGDDELFYSTPILTKNNEIVLVGFHGLPNTGVAATVLKYNKNGEKLWGREFNPHGGTNQNYFRDIHQTFDDGFIICGSLTNLSAFESPMWAVKLDSIGCEVANCSVGVEAPLPPKGELVYPNPTTGVINIALQKIPEPNTTIQLFDITGTMVLSQALKQATTQLTINNYPKGIYLYQINNSKQTHYGKIIAQ